ncbi:MAG: tRNA uridine-5-carboxymethylaminomethyl(34) synthesis GTPase MnmE [Clostridia bacterium]|nr:tRNA uridine-5-carboxymethylaminomethyl(34) synthesis GTPase MnmE [Clostridia bacterium]
MFHSTVAAISTARGKGGVAMLRISGEDALSVAYKMFTLPSGKSLFDVSPRVCYYGNIVRDGRAIDDGTFTYFKAPHSFTGEDVCEICCHGGLYVTQAVLELALSCGAEMAGAGEFTKRAYVNGKLTLSRAEAIGQVIDASNDAQLRLSGAAARGALSNKLLKIREYMLDLITRSYATIDYPDEDIEDNERSKMSDTLSLVLDELNKLKSSYRASKAVSEGIKTAIVGKPNAGKSSLYNALCGEELAIVTDIAGTTRDVIEHTASVGDVTLRLADTAGIRDTDDTVEQIGVTRAMQKLNEAEIVLCVFDGSEKETNQDYKIIEDVNGKCAVAVINKSDSQRALSEDFVAYLYEKFQYVCEISAKSADGLDGLARVLNEMYELDKIDISNDAVIANARQLSSLTLALDKVNEAKNALDLGETPDIICFSLENALSELDMIDARATSEEIVSEIFSRFCVGK